MHDIAQHKIVFLDRDSLIANIRQPAFAHILCRREMNRRPVVAQLRSA